MPIFAPFSYLKNPPTPPAWTPASFTNAQYWWRADLGVTDAGSGKVSAWEDQINGFTMVQGTGANRPDLTTSANLNSQAVIQTNGTSEFMYTTTAPAARTDDFTMLGVFRINTTNTGGALMGVCSSGLGRIWIDTIASYIRMYNQGFGQPAGLATNLLTSGVIGEHAVKLRYDSSAGDVFTAIDTLSETGRGTTGNIGQAFGTTTTMPFGALVINQSGGVFAGRYVGMDMAEQVMIYGTPTTDEMNEWKDYVNTRYGTIIS